MNEDDLKILKDLYGLSGAEVLLVRSDLKTIESSLGRQLDLRYPLDGETVERYLSGLGIERAAKDLNKVVQEYGHQLVYEGTIFHNKEKLESGKSVLERISLGDHRGKEGD